MDYKSILEDLLKREYEASWFDFKENWLIAFHECR